MNTTWKWIKRTGSFIKERPFIVLLVVGITFGMSFLFNKLVNDPLTTTFSVPEIEVNSFKEFKEAVKDTTNVSKYPNGTRIIGIDKSMTPRSKDYYENDRLNGRYSYIAEDVLTFHSLLDPNVSIVEDRIKVVENQYKNQGGMAMHFKSSMLTDKSTEDYKKHISHGPDDTLIYYEKDPLTGMMVKYGISKQDTVGSSDVSLFDGKVKLPTTMFIHTELGLPVEPNSPPEVQYKYIKDYDSSTYKNVNNDYLNSLGTSSTVVVSVPKKYRYRVVPYEGPVEFGLRAYLGKVYIDEESYIRPLNR